MNAATQTPAVGQGCGALLAGRRIVIVGGGQQDYGQEAPPAGIGRATSLLCAREGAAVAVLDRDGEAAERTAAEARASGVVAVALAADASDEKAMAEAVVQAEEELGALDGLVNVVGVAGGQGLGGTSSEVWDLVLATNVRAHFLATKHIIPRMPEGGSVVFVSSTAPRVPSTNDMPAYLASKAALEGLSAHVAREGAHGGVRANVVRAGLIDTSLGRLATQVKPERASIPIPLARQGTAWEVAEAVVFLLSDRSGYVTGQTLAVDGGLTGAS